MSEQRGISLSLFLSADFHALSSPPGQTCVGYLYTCNIVDMLKKDKRPTQPPETRAPVVQTNVPSRRPVTPAPIETSEPSRFEMQWVDPDEEDWGDPDEEEEDWGDPVSAPPTNVLLSSFDC